jgi:hypothetical protein
VADDDGDIVARPACGAAAGYARRQRVSDATPSARFGPDSILLTGITDPDPGRTAFLIEPPKRTVHASPVFVLDHSDQGVPRCGMWGLPRDVHGTYLLSRSDCLLMGGNLLIERSGAWYCESLLHRSHLVAFFGTDTFDAVFPGPKPRLTVEDTNARVDLSHLGDGDISRIDEPVFLATAAEPDNWGRWIVQVIPRLAWFKQHGHRHKLLCRAAHGWQHALLRYFGVTDALIVHDPGRAHWCRDIAMLQDSSADGTVTDRDRALFMRIADTCSGARGGGIGPRIFVSRLSDAAQRPDYRVLRNEAALIEALRELGFAAVEPARLTFEEQVRVFAGASVVVGLGGAGMFNVAFCRPGTKVVTIEATDTFITGHSGIFSSLGLQYGVIYGRQDVPADGFRHPHLSWTVDVPRVVTAVRGFL